MPNIISAELRERNNKQVEKVLNNLIEQASKSVEDVIKSLIVEKVTNLLGPLISKPIIKTLAHEAVKKAVDTIWERNKEKISEKLDNL